MSFYPFCSWRPAGSKFSSFSPHCIVFLHDGGWPVWAKQSFFILLNYWDTVTLPMQNKLANRHFQVWRSMWPAAPCDSAPSNNGESDGTLSLDCQTKLISFGKDGIWRIGICWIAMPYSSLFGFHCCLGILSIQSYLKLTIQWNKSFSFYKL